MKAYSELLIQTCHKRRAHAIGGMAAQIPIKEDPVANEKALEKVLEDKKREAQAGHDGTWIAHPGLAPIALDAFNDIMPGKNQLHNKRTDIHVSANDLLQVPKGEITEEGVRSNIRIGIQYLEAWLSGNGCVPLYNLMEDAATAEISRAQLWQWAYHKSKLNDGTLIDFDFINLLIDQELHTIQSEVGENKFENGKFTDASKLFFNMIKNNELDEFLTLPAYNQL